MKILYFLKRMNRLGIIGAMKVVFQNRPKLIQGIFVHLDANACLYSFVCPVLSDTSPFKRITTHDNRRHIPHIKPCFTTIEKSIQILLSWQALVDPRHGFINHPLHTHVFQKRHQLFKQSTNFSSGSMLIGNQSSICESLMRPKRISNDIGRKHGIELIALEKHQRVIVESFTMILHISTVKEERALFRQLHKVVPGVFVAVTVSPYFKHLPIYISRKHHNHIYNHPHQKDLPQEPSKRHPMKSRSTTAKFPCQQTRPCLAG